MASVSPHFLEIAVYYDFAGSKVQGHRAVVGQRQTIVDNSIDIYLLLWRIGLRAVRGGIFYANIRLSNEICILGSSLFRSSH